VAFAFNEFLDEFDGFGGDFGSAEDPLGFAAAADFQNIAFGFVEDGLDFMGPFVGTDDDLGASLLEFAKKAFVAHLGEVGAGGEDADDACGEITDEGGSASGVGEFTIIQPSEEGGGIDGLAGLVHLDNATEEDLVGGVKKIFFAKTLFSGDIDDVLGVGEHSAEEGAFGFEIMVNGKPVDGDRGGRFATSPRTSGLGFGNHREVSFLCGVGTARVGQKLLKNKLGKGRIRVNKFRIPSVRSGA
jgi:hypothetical protein